MQNVEITVAALICVSILLLMALAIALFLHLRKDNARMSGMLKEALEMEKERSAFEKSRFESSFEFTQEKIWDTVLRVANMQPEIPSDELAARLLSANGLIREAKPGKHCLSYVIDEINRMEREKAAAA